MVTPTPNRVPFRVNLLLTVAFFVQSVAVFMFHRRDITKREPVIETLPYLRDHRVVQVLVGIGAIIAAVVLFVWLLHEVWNHVVAAILPVRQMTFSETYALSLLLFAITLWVTP